MCNYLNEAQLCNLAVAPPGESIGATENQYRGPVENSHQPSTPLSATGSQTWISLFLPSGTPKYADIHHSRIFENSVPFVSCRTPRGGGVTSWVILTHFLTTRVPSESNTQFFWKMFAYMPFDVDQQKEHLSSCYGLEYYPLTDKLKIKKKHSNRHKL